MKDGFADCARCGNLLIEGEQLHCSSCQADIDRRSELADEVRGEVVLDDDLE